MAMSRSLGGTSFTSRPPMWISPSVGVVQPGDHVEQRRLAAARGADQDQELAGVDLDVDALEDLDAVPKLLLTLRY